MYLPQQAEYSATAVLVVSCGRLEPRMCSWTKERFANGIPEIGVVGNVVLRRCIEYRQSPWLDLDQILFQDQRALPFLHSLWSLHLTFLLVVGSHNS
jgi:hypothetical protein